MRRTIALFAVLGLLGIAGCESWNKKETSSSDPKMMSADVCSHCPGVQTANSEGKCPICTGKK